MNKTIDRIRKECPEREIPFFASLAGSFAMGTLHLINTLKNFSWLTFSYALFCYLMMFGRVLIWHAGRKKSQNLYLYAALIVLAVLIPMAAALVETIFNRDTPVYLFDWLVYGYALYGTVKMVTSIMKLKKNRNAEADEQKALAWLSLISACYTLFMMEFTLIRTFSEAQDLPRMYPVIMGSNFAILILTVVTMVMFMARFLWAKRERG